MNKGPVDLLEHWLKTQLWVDRLKLDSEKQLIWDLNQARKQLIAMILDGDMQGRYKSLLRQAEGMIHDVYARHREELYPELKEIARQEYDRSVLALNSHAQGVGITPRGSFETLPKNAITALYDMDRLILPTGGGGETKAYFLKDLVSGDKAVEKLRSTLANGLIMGSSNQDMERALRAWSGMQINASRAVVRTAISSVMERSRVEAFSKFGDTITGYRWVSVFDGRTTLGCRALHNKRFQREVDAPPRPRHFRCRSVLVPLTRLSDKEGEEEGYQASAVHDKRTVEHRDGTTSTQFKIDRERSGLIPKNMTQDEWFRSRLTEAEQIDYLGKRRYELFKSGRLKFADLVGKDWQPLTLKDLDQKLSGQLPLPTVSPIATKSNDWAKGMIKKHEQKDAPQDIKQVIERLDQPGQAKAIRGQRSFSLGNEIYIHPSQDNADVWWHEYGHHVDKELGRKRTGKAESYISSTEDYKKAVLLDSDNIIANQKRADALAELIVPGRNWNEARDEILRDKVIQRALQSNMSMMEQLFSGFTSRDSLGKVFWDSIGDADRLMLDNVARALYLHDSEDYRYMLWLVKKPFLEQGRLQGYTNLADLLGSTTLNKVGWGHKDDYYKKYRAGRFTENFANLFNALTRGENSLDWKLAQRFAPNSARELRLKLREIDDE